MSDLTLSDVTQNYYDVLKEIGNIGAGNAMTALSQMLGCKIDMGVPQVDLLDFSEVGTAIGGEEQIMVDGVLVVPVERYLRELVPGNRLPESVWMSHAL